MKRIVLDQGLPATAGMILREDGWDAVHVREIEMHEATDLEILDYAARESRVVITLDRDFPQILALTSAARPSVILLRQQRLRATIHGSKGRCPTIRRSGSKGERSSVRLPLNCA